MRIPEEKEGKESSAKSREPALASAKS